MSCRHLVLAIDALKEPDKVVSGVRVVGDPDFEERPAAIADRNCIDAQCPRERRQLDRQLAFDFRRALAVLSGHWPNLTERQPPVQPVQLCQFLGRKHDRNP